MRQLTFIAPGNLEWQDVPAPRIEAAGDVLVRPKWVARCDLDYHIAAGLAPLPGPFAFGHETIAEVAETGDGVRCFKPGDLVAVPFQISCGACAHCRKGWTNACLSVPRGAVFGMKPLCGVEYGGALSELMRVPFADHMLLAVPENVPPQNLASIPDNAPDGWRTVAPHMEKYESPAVLVMGGTGSVGLYAVAAAVALGAAHVLYADHEARRLKTAQEIGAQVQELRDADAVKSLGSFPITVDSSGDIAALRLAIRSTAACGTCTSTSVFFDDAVPLPMLRMYTKGITFITERVHSRAAMPDVLEKTACGHFHPEKVTSRIVPFSQAAEAMDDPAPKLVFECDW